MESGTSVLVVGIETVSGVPPSAILERACDGVRTVECKDPSDAVARLREASIDCVVSGYRLAGTNGIEFYHTVRRIDSPTPPFVLVGERVDGDVVEKAIAAGVTDHVRDRGEGIAPKMLANRVGNAVELHQLRDRATELSRFDAVMRRINRRLVEATSHEEVDRQVCEAFSDVDPHLFAWIGSVTDGERVRPRTAGSVEKGYLDAITITADGSATGQGPAGTALREERVVVQRVEDGNASAPWGDEALARGYRSVAAVPLVRDGTRYGVLCVYGDGPRAFGGVDRAVFEELGETVAHAYRRVDLQRTHERQYRRLFEEAPVMFALVETVDDTPVVDDCNRLFAETLGYARDELRGTPLAELYTDGATETLLRDGYDRARTGDLVRERRELVTKDGGTVPTLLRATPRRDADGDIIGTHALYVDIEGQAQVERLEALRERMEFALDITDSHVYEIDLQSGIRTRYGAFERLFGVESGAVPTGDAFYETCVHPDDRERLERAERTEPGPTREGPTRIEYRTHPDNGPVRWVRSVMYCQRTPHNTGSPSRLVGLATDVTDRRKREEQLETTTATLSRRTETLERFLETVVDQKASFETQVERVLDVGREHLDMDVAAVVRVGDDDLAVEYAVAPADGTAGLTLDDTCCSSLVSAGEPVGFHNPTAGDAETRAVSRNCGGCSYLGAPIYTGDDRYGVLCFSSPETRDEPFDDDERTFVRLFAQWVGSELARRRSQARAKRHQERLEARNERLDEFASVVSHDLRSPLNAAQGRLELLREDHESEHVDGIDTALSGIEALATDLLQLARQGKRVHDPTAVDLPALVEECWGTVRTADTTLRVETTRTLSADRSRLRQLVENLVRNAIEHGGSNVTVGDLDDGFYVADDGPGIPVDDRETVFDGGYTTQTDGTGMGLSIVREVAVAHGWTVEVVESAAGGARFEITGTENASAER
ncbi:MAG: GAF domain-containing protein [Haloplanus sp.]